MHGSGDVGIHTIAAVATPPGRGGIGVVRISGPRAPAIAAKLLGRLPDERKATLCGVRDAEGALIDQAIAIFFPPPGSYTGEAVLEIHGHGGPVVMHALLAACLDAGARLAEPGEFTRRAFLRGKLDLAQAEAVADLIDATSREAARSALRSLSGEFSRAVSELVSGLVELRALTESMLDFPEEQLEPLGGKAAAGRLDALRAALDKIIARSRQGGLLRAGIQVVLAGAPNVGKSSLLNRLADEERAIVTAIPGTTRDALHVSIHLEGVPVTLVDTAGLRESADEIERLGMERAHQELARADLVLLVSEAGEVPVAIGRLPEGVARIDVVNKIDLQPAAQPRIEEGGRPRVLVSARTGAGIDLLRRRILEAAGWVSGTEPGFLARERHLRALRSAAGHLRDAADAIEQWDLFAEELRLAQVELNQITGEFGADELLGEIFGRFCIGK